jgi:two-component system, LytTR family, response regulator
MRVMLVDDERPCLDELEYLLAQHGDITITGTYTNPLEALEAVKHSASDTAFLDISMPYMSGTELAEALLKITPGMHIVFVTAYSKLLAGAKGMPSNGSILKPVSGQIVDEVLKRLRSGNS